MGTYFVVPASRPWPSWGHLGGAHPQPGLWPRLPRPQHHRALPAAWLTWSLIQGFILKRGHRCPVRSAPLPCSQVLAVPKARPPPAPSQPLSHAGPSILTRRQGLSSRWHLPAPPHQSPHCPCRGWGRLWSGQVKSICPFISAPGVQHVARGPTVCRSPRRVRVKAVAGCSAGQWGAFTGRRGPAAALWPVRDLGVHLCSSLASGCWSRSLCLCPNCWEGERA